MNNTAVRVIDIRDKRTSMRLTPCEWKAIDMICQRENIKRKKLFELIDTNKDPKLGLTSSIRLFTLIYYKNTVMKTINPTIAKQLKNPIFDAIKSISAS
ncbi:MAG: ribbon-helix-helix domain-containing protein [Alphaproteobacteria bacterium]|nr:ribbon-helix-helix domain-containing protein [Alphaproteobacteria bacterium]